MALYGTMMGGAVLLSPDSSAGVPVVPADAPEAPDGYVARGSWVQANGAITQVWSLEPAQGTAADAALALARMQAASLADGDAVKVAALYPEWTPGEPSYAAGQRVRLAGALYRCLQTHRPQADWAPGAAPSLWAEVLPGQGGTAAGEWRQPDSTNPYRKGDRVTHGGRLWESAIDNNVWEPMDGQPNLWKEVAA